MHPIKYDLDIGVCIAELYFLIQKNNDIFIIMQIININNDEPEVCIICLQTTLDDNICDDSSEFIYKTCLCNYNLHKQCIINWVNVSKKSRCLYCNVAISLRETKYQKIKRVLCSKNHYYRTVYLNIICGYCIKLLLYNLCVNIIIIVIFYLFYY